MSQVTCLGILVADIVGKPVNSLPERGTLRAIERVELHSGGCAANTAVSLAKLGVSSSVIGKVGADGLGDFLTQTLAGNGVDTTGIVRCSDGTPTSATMVLVDDTGERTFLHAVGANAAFGLVDIDWKVVESAPILHIAGPYLLTGFMGEGSTSAVRRAHEMGKLTTLDTVWDPTERWMSTLAGALPFLDYVLPSLEEARRITGRNSPEEIAQVLLDAGVGTVGLKLGDQGCYICTRSGYKLTVPALPVAPVDSLGAGDAWVAGFLCGLINEWDLEKTAVFANATGACCVQALGATAGIKGFEDTCRLAFS